MGLDSLHVTYLTCPRKDILFWPNYWDVGFHARTFLCSCLSISAWHAASFGRGFFAYVKREPHGDRVMFSRFWKESRSMKKIGVDQKNNKKA